MNAMTMFQLEAFPVLQDPKKVSTINKDFIIFNDLRSMPIYSTPTRLETSVFCVCLNGFTRITVNMQEYYIGPGSIMVALPDQIIQSMEISDDYQCACIAVSRDYTDEAFAKLKIMLPFYFYTKEYPCLNLKGEELNHIMEYYNMFWERIDEVENECYRDILINLFVTMMYEIYNIYRRRLPRTMARKNRKEVLFDQFMRMLSDNYRLERSVNYYAKELFLTPKHLSSVVKEVSGKTAGEWIDNFVIFEAKSLLKSSQKNIQEIADELNFANQSFFGKYFKHYTGMSPKDYRRK